MLRKLILPALPVILLFLALNSCFKETKNLSPALIQFDEIPFKNLTEYGFFKGDLANLDPSDGVLLYEPVSSLFTDYAFKSRFVWMPEGTSAIIPEDPDAHLIFPDRSVLIKNFYYPDDFNNEDGNKRIIETRLLVKYEGEWQAYPYLWNEEQDEAILKITGASLPVSFTHWSGAEHAIDYIQPNKNQCKSCHNRGEKLVPIGPKIKNLNCDLEYPDGSITNQLVRWAEAGYLSGFARETEYPAMVDYSDPSVPLDLRAKAYLDINCGHCHHADAPASTSGLFLTYEEDDPMRWGIWKTPVAAGIGAGPHTFDILPGKADSSILLYRMNSDRAGVMMAEIGRVMIHEEGVELVREWINSLENEKPL